MIENNQISKYKLLIVDDEKSISNALLFAFENTFEVYCANNIMEFNRVVNNTKPDIVLLDLKFGTEDGMELLKHIKSIYSDTVVIVMTAYGTIKSSIEAIKIGAFDYILKPIDLAYIKKLLEDAIRFMENRKKNLITCESKNLTIIGKSPKMEQVFEKINRIKDVNVNVLITGESGVGKDLIARAIHYEGKRKCEPFIVVNCAAIPQNLIESELFGYEKGAFTGADKSKKGAFELADKGSIFLDEIGEMDVYCQAKVLRVLQNKEIVPVGSGIAKNIDVRIIAATNKNLAQEVEKGNFRMDLFYRLNVFPINVASLHERKEDIALLVEHFISKANDMYGMDIKYITNGALEILKSMNYKGNVRQLENIIYRACILADHDYIDEKCIQLENSNEKNEYKDTMSVRIGSSLDDIEKQMILSTLDYVNGNKTQAAKLLGISERSIHYKIKSYNEDNSSAD